MSRPPDSIKACSERKLYGDIVGIRGLKLLFTLQMPEII